MNLKSQLIEVLFYKVIKQVDLQSSSLFVNLTNPLLNLFSHMDSIKRGVKDGMKNDFYHFSFHLLPIRLDNSM
jgi:hypothetical protein